MALGSEHSSAGTQLTPVQGATASCDMGNVFMLLSTYSETCQVIGHGACSHLNHHGSSSTVLTHPGSLKSSLSVLGLDISGYLPWPCQLGGGFGNLAHSEGSLKGFCRIIIFNLSGIMYLLENLMKILGLLF